MNECRACWDDGLLFTDGIVNWDQEKTNKCLNAHGVSIIEVTKRTGLPWDPKRRKGDSEPPPILRVITKDDGGRIGT